MADHVIPEYHDTAGSDTSGRGSIDLDTIRERHVCVDTHLTMDTTADMCACGDRWPCDTRVVLDALDTQDRVMQHAAWQAEGPEAGDALIDGWQAEAAHTKALAEALRPYVESGVNLDYSQAWANAERALAAFDADHTPTSERSGPSFRKDDR